MAHDSWFLLSEYLYDLPIDRIAHLPTDPPESARMLCYTRSSGDIEHRVFGDLPEILWEISVQPAIFFNDTRVIPARVIARVRVIKRGVGLSLSEIKNILPTDQARDRDIELLYIWDRGVDQFESMVYPGDTFPIGSIVQLGEYIFRTIEITYQGRIFEKITPFESSDFLDQQGTYPLPPYITPSVEAQSLYNTEFATHRGSLAAPTASLHFTKWLIERCILAGAGVHYLTLHVGIGTFKIMNTSDIRDHTMHSEWASVSGEIFEWIYQYKSQGRPILAVGTTMVRLLESLPDVWKKIGADIEISPEGKNYWDDLTHTLTTDSIVERVSLDHGRITFETQIYIMPGYVFRIVDQIITNFHLPESTLLAMVGACMGLSELHRVYALAIAEKYRFYSFGDGMYIR